MRTPSPCGSAHPGDVIRATPTRHRAPHPRPPPPRRRRTGNRMQSRCAREARPSPPTCRPGRRRNSDPAPAGVDLIATTKGTIARSTPRRGGRKDGTVPGRWYGSPSSLPVIGQRRMVQGPARHPPQRVDRYPGRAAERDHHRQKRRTGSSSDLAAEHLRLYRLGRQIMNAPAGIGTRQDPTPTGQYFVAMLEEFPQRHAVRSSSSPRPIPTRSATGKRGPTTR